MNDKELVETGEQVVRTRGRPKGSGGNTRTDMLPQMEPGDNAKYLEIGMRIAGLPKVDMSNEHQVAQRIDEYFKICAEYDHKPSIEGMALALDVDRRYLWEIREGRKGKNPEVADTLKRAVKLLQLYLSDCMQNGKINPVSGIFLLKNNFGYQDKQEVIVTPNNPLGDGTDPKQIEDKYTASAVVDIQ